jgi:hypothetical protein
MILMVSTYIRASPFFLGCGVKPFQGKALFYCLYKKFTLNIFIR